MMKQREYG